MCVCPSLLQQNCCTYDAAIYGGPPVSKLMRINQAHISAAVTYITVDAWLIQHTAHGNWFVQQNCCTNDAAMYAEPYVQNRKKLLWVIVGLFSYLKNKNVSQQ